MNWRDARSWVEDLVNHDGGEWRLPAVNELSTLYLGVASKFPVDLAVPDPGRYVWSGEEPAPYRAMCIEFASGRILPLYKKYAGLAHAMAVRPVETKAPQGVRRRPSIHRPAVSHADRFQTVVFSGSLENIDKKNRAPIHP